MMKRLNLVCGKDIREGYVNLDMYQLPGVDVIGQSFFHWYMSDSSAGSSQPKKCIMR